MSQKPETVFRARVAAFLKKMDPPIFFESIQQRSIVGTPDLLCCVNGCFLAIEIKSAKGKLSALQKVKLQKIIDAGGIGITISPNNWEEAKYVLETLNKENPDVEDFVEHH